MIRPKNRGDIQDNLLTRETGKLRFLGGANIVSGKENAMTCV